MSGLGCAAAGGPAARLDDAGLGYGCAARGQLGGLVETGRRAGDRLERAVEDAQRALGDITDHVLALRLELDQVEALDGDLLGQLLVDRHAQERHLLRKDGVQPGGEPTVDLAGGRGSLSFKTLDRLAGRSDRVRSDLGRGLGGSERYFLA